MYDRSRPPEMSAFLNEENDIAEEDENVVEETPQPALSEVDKARLNSCVEEIQNVIGDAVPISSIQETVTKYNYDLTKALDAILNASNAKKRGIENGKRNDLVTCRR